MTMLDIRNFKNWTKISNGYYRFVIASSVAYEILIEFWYVDSPIETAKASLCIVGEWKNKNAASSLEREWLGKDLPIQELLEIAYNDNEENNK